MSTNKKTKQKENLERLIMQKENTLVKMENQLDTMVDMELITYEKMEKWQCFILDEKRELDQLKKKMISSN